MVCKKRFKTCLRGGQGVAFRCGGEYKRYKETYKTKHATYILTNTAMFGSRKSSWAIKSFRGILALYT